MSKNKDPALDLVQYFKVIEDPRVTGRCEHLLVDVLVIAVCAVISSAKSWVEIEEFGVQREGWLSQYLELSGGIPSHDTFARVFSLIEPTQFEEVFTNWVKETMLHKPKRLCLDGKSVAGTERTIHRGKRALHLVSLYSKDLGLVLAQSIAKSTGCGEAEGALDCLERVEVKGALISADAGLSIHRITEKIREKKADYLIPLKMNQRFTLNEVKEHFQKKKKYETAIEEKKSHGRTEKRHCLIDDAETLSEAFHEQWRDVKTLIKMTRTRKEKDHRFLVQKTGKDGKQFYEKNAGNEWKITQETVFYISSRNLTASRALEAIQEQWSIENNLHWQLDVSFSEDQWRAKEKVAARNLAQIRKFALNLVKRVKDKGSVRVKMQRAAWNLEYLEKIVFG